MVWRVFLASWSVVGSMDPQPGWYGDPAEPAQLRWWNGSTWTSQVVVPKDPSLKVGLSIAFGAISLVAWYVPIAGLVFSASGLTLAWRARKGAHHELALVGRITSIIGLAVSLVALAWSLFIGLGGIVVAPAAP
jgi:Protein of unknown function (DUF2510)